MAKIPRAALAVVIVTAAIAIIDVAGCRSLAKVNPVESVLAVVAALGVIVFRRAGWRARRHDPSIVVALFRISGPTTPSSATTRASTAGSTSGPTRKR